MFLHKEIGFWANEDDNALVKCADLENRPQYAVLPGEKGAQVSSQVERAAEERPPRYLWYLLGRTCRRGGRGG